MRLTALGSVALGVWVAIAACAAPLPPPGGPPDTKPATLLSVMPESGSVNVTPRAVVFKFSEVIAERPSGAPTLAGIVLFSPQSGEADVTWSRDEIYVRPGRGWRPDAVYSITLLPGVTDLRNNVLKQKTITVFSTGASIPETKITGVAFDWVKGLAVPNAFVEALRVRDSTVYITLADSGGRFVLPHLPPDTYVVKATVDGNNNRKREPREPWDSAVVALRDSAGAELYAFVHDTLGPRVTTITVRDSVTVRLMFDQPLAPTQQFSPSSFVLRASDSSLVAIARVQPAVLFDSLDKVRIAERAKLRADSVAKADTTKKGREAAVTAAARRDSLARRDSVARADSVIRREALAAADTGAVKRLPPAKTNRVSPPLELVLELEQPLQPISTYRLRADGLIGLLGASRPTDRAFVTARAKGDTTSKAAPLPRGRRPATPPTTPPTTPATPPATTPPVTPVPLPPTKSPAR